MVRRSIVDRLAGGPNLVRVFLLDLNKRSMCALVTSAYRIGRNSWAEKSALGSTFVTAIYGVLEVLQDR